MSTKVYNGFHFKAVDTGRFMRDFRKLQTERLVKVMTDFYEKFRADNPDADRIAQDVNNHLGERMKIKREGPFKERYDEIVSWVMVLSVYILADKFRAAALDVDSWVNMFFDGEEVYAYGKDGRYFIQAKDMPDYCHDFSYWNNSDPDPDVADADWEFRKKTWGRILDDTTLKATFTVVAISERLHGGFRELLGLILSQEISFMVEVLALRVSESMVEKEKAKDEETSNERGKG